METPLFSRVLIGRMATPHGTYCIATSASFGRPNPYDRSRRARENPGNG